MEGGKRKRLGEHARWGECGAGDGRRGGGDEAPPKKQPWRGKEREGEMAREGLPRCCFSLSRSAAGVAVTGIDASIRLTAWPCSETCAARATL